MEETNALLQLLGISKEEKPGKKKNKLSEVAQAAEDNYGQTYKKPENPPRIVTVGIRG